MPFQDGLKLKNSKLDALAALRSPVSVLLGVSAQTADTLGKLGIKSVFDLAESPLFKVSAEMVNAADGVGNSPMARLGRVPAGVVDQDGEVTPAVLLDKDVSAFREIGTALASEVKNRLQVETVGELGRWPAFKAARNILDAAIPPKQDDENGAGELVPKLGEYPTERHYYTSVVIDHVVPGTTTDLATAGPIDIAPATTAEFGFRAPAVGAIITLAQSWFAQGVTLGNLLHSVALAPGESTRIAVVDWSRRTSASGEEAITEAERLTNASNHSRAISEVQEAVATEVQTGFSKSSGTSSTIAGGGGFGFSAGPISVGGSASGAKTKTTAQSFSSSAGSRNLAASMSQRVSDSTQQAASSVRERRASIVKEVSESEHESVSTRILANYNHMHALTIQYFEVVEIYRMTVQVHQVERCLFVPMKLVDFNDATMERFQSVLAEAALTRRARELLSAELGMVRLQPSQPVRRINVFDRVAALDRLAAVRTRTRIAARRVDGETPTEPEPEGGDREPTTPEPLPETMTAPPTNAWISEELARASRIVMCGVVRPNVPDLFLPGDAELTGIDFTLQLEQGTEAVALTAVEVTSHSGGATPLTTTNPVSWTASTPVPLQEIDQLRVSTALGSRLLGRMTLQFSYRGARFPISIPVEIGVRATAQILARGIPQESGTELRLHLQENRLHYSEAIWRSLDASTTALLLSGMSFEGTPVVDLIDPNPVMIAGNYMVFRMPGFVEAVGVPSGEEAGNSPLAVSRKKWKEWLKERGLILGSETAAEQLVPIPTGGVFAEAVLGRSNSAEKLDATRFWNWQDSPIPLQPPEISAIQLASRAQPIDVTPGQLGQPVLNIMNPTSLPDPTGLGAAFGALQNGNMFRDMSGLAATAGLAQALSSNATTASTEAGRQAAANLAVAAQKDIESQKIAAQVAMAAMGLPSANTGTPKNISEGGALLNTAAAMDAKGVPVSGAQSSSAGSNGSSGSGSESGGSSSGGSSSGGEVVDGSFMPGVSGFGSGSSSRADDVRSRLTWGNLGAPAGSLILASQNVGSGSGSNAPQTPSLTIFELSLHGSYPNPFTNPEVEHTAMQNDKWTPSDEDFAAVGGAATSSSSSNSNRPNALEAPSIFQLLDWIKFFAPMSHGINPQPSRIKRLNLFVYANSTTLALKGTRQITGGIDHGGVSAPDINARVVNKSVLDKIRTNQSNKDTLAQIRKAWNEDGSSELWLYCSGGVPGDPLCTALAKLLGVTVRAFDDNFFVLPTMNPDTERLDRVEVGLGLKFSSAMANKYPNLHAFDRESTRKIPA